MLVAMKTHLFDHDVTFDGFCFSNDHKLELKACLLLDIIDECGILDHLLRKNLKEFEKRLDWVGIVHDAHFI